MLLFGSCSPQAFEMSICFLWVDVCQSVIRIVVIVCGFSQMQVDAAVAVLGSHQEGPVGRIRSQEGSPVVWAQHAVMVRAGLSPASQSWRTSSCAEALVLCSSRP